MKSETINFKGQNIILEGQFIVSDQMRRNLSDIRHCSFAVSH